MKAAPSLFSTAISRFEPELPLAVGFSGGADSAALLVACARKWPGQVRAVHVHHGLQAAADEFERHCVSLCEQLGIPLEVMRVDARHAPGESPEDAARRARRVALVEGKGDAKSIALAQHADDQVETLLLALSRGAGLPGLAAMPPRWKREGVTWHRPLLEVPGADLREWLRGEGIAWIEDPTNTDIAFTRNRIRAKLLPALQEAFPQFRETFARSARHAAQAASLLEEVAKEDLATTGNPPAIQALRSLPRARRGNALRHWLKASHGAAPSAAQLEELLDQVEACTTRGHKLRLKVAMGFVERDGDKLRYTA